VNKRLAALIAALLFTTALAGCVNVPPVRVVACATYIDNVHGSTHYNATMNVIAQGRCYGQMHQLVIGAEIERRTGNYYSYVGGSRRTSSHYEVKAFQFLRLSAYTYCAGGDYRGKVTLEGQATDYSGVSYTPAGYTSVKTRNPCVRPFQFMPPDW
jgi:hypothetical protein